MPNFKTFIHQLVKNAVFTLAISCALYITLHYFVYPPYQQKAGAEEKARQEKCLDGVLATHSLDWSLACSELPTSSKTCSDWSLAVRDYVRDINRYILQGGTAVPNSHVLGDDAVAKCSCAQLPPNEAEQLTDELLRKEAECRHAPPS